MGRNTAYKIENSTDAEASTEKFFESRIVGNAPPSDVKSEGIEWLNTDEAALFLRISAASLRNLCSNGKIPFYKWQRRNRYKKDELRSLLLATRRGGSDGN